MNILDKKSVLVLFIVTLLLFSSYADDHNLEDRLLASNGLTNGFKNLFNWGIRQGTPKIREAIAKHQQSFKFGYKIVKGGYELAGFGCLKECSSAPKPPCSKPNCLIQIVKTGGDFKRTCKMLVFYYATSMSDGILVT
ncbi:hypothetical protein M8C21_030217 [Ambrosia artemisiifolia]|uniref:Uncharacterized protein n=1 Tax=Ambrosia artemisiifolia TaxID=4212 RepID=A0AAD5CMK4_AMBAR|nr:hypothetical protein M8C21_030217 [Ambrosia artemisiifolia]